MADEGCATRRALSVENWNEVVAILTSNVLSALAGDCFQCWIEVGVAGHGIGLLTCLDTLGPTNNKGHAVTTFVEVSFVASETPAGVMAMLFQYVEVALGRTSIVGSENNEGVLVYTVLLQSGK